ncbi:adenosylcobinamide-phosphate synthase CbiB [Maribellus sp. YY47]|uniref:adenosylcobinamide-phosphate synthase CbiB n=1 Tax=Maribellus sp. YY47 TaxID=2929486 RepID=UPI0020018437|nr:adenosylcobinamide-phosphate synthase CbiB [Maribellus sp. YY47]MCK3685238.1 adenosylcobinamide-phosphate synthase CbiB [Maribellus sp. YY47]
MTDYPDIIYPLLAGFLLDLLIGDPHWLPHPIRWFGWLISKGETLLNKGDRRRWKGAFLTIALVLFVFFVLWFGLMLLPEKSIVFYVIASILVFFGLANRSLIYESLLVIRRLKQEGIEAGRKQLSRIVGRDTSNLNEQQIRTAVLETLAENLSDGVIAPLFYFAIGGVPGMFAYKMVNTLDSMIGYKNDRYREFGFFAARLDDVLNFIPARLTAFLMVLVTLRRRGFSYLFKFGNQHSSPNAGYPEAALSGILNCRFGGPNIYHGKLVKKPFIGLNFRILSDSDVYKSCGINMAVALLSVFLICVFFMYNFRIL